MVSVELFIAALVIRWIFPDPLMAQLLASIALLVSLALLPRKLFSRSVQQGAFIAVALGLLLVGGVAGVQSLRAKNDIIVVGTSGTSRIVRESFARQTGVPIGSSLLQAPSLLSIALVGQNINLRGSLEDVIPQPSHMLRLLHAFDPLELPLKPEFTGFFVSFIRGVHDLKASFELAESSLYDAAYKRKDLARYGYHALSRFVLGTAGLATYQSDQELICAYQQLRNAYRVIPQRYPILRLSILNNQAVALSEQWFRNGDKRAQKQAIELLEAAFIQIERHPQLAEYAETIFFNRKAITKERKRKP